MSLCEIFFLYSRITRLPKQDKKRNANYVSPIKKVELGLANMLFFFLFSFSYIIKIERRAQVSTLGLGAGYLPSFMKALVVNNAIS